ncbi:hypothetical protein EYC59_06420 [Candidatus Saccharibacteria bacterium]|nr:MAG: hypothetical protein EYC59_06420 [Candidatus Saccharibacteria bacterium]
MKPFVLTVRAVGCEFAGRYVKALQFPFGMGAVGVTLVLVWLVHFSAWWLLLAVPLWFVMLFGVGLLVLAHMVVRAFRPPQDREQRAAVAGFVDKLQRVSEVVGTPAYWLLIKTVRDIVRPRQDGFIVQTATDSVTLHKDFLAVQRSFR